MRKYILFILAIGIFLSLIFSYTTYEIVTKTGTAKYCISCHEMAPMKASYDQDVHGGSGKSGIKASCVSCHLPHDNMVNYLFIKTKKGIKESAIHYFTDTNKIDWHKKREQRDTFVYDSGCIKCHTNYDINNKYSSKAIQMHSHYKELLNTNKKLTCASCHVEVGHNGLNNMLNIYDPVHEIYKKEMIRKKEKIDQKLFIIEK